MYLRLSATDKVSKRVSLLFALVFPNEYWSSSKKWHCRIESDRKRHSSMPTPLQLLVTASWCGSCSSSISGRFRWHCHLCQLLSNVNSITPFACQFNLYDKYRVRRDNVLLQLQWNPIFGCLDIHTVCSYYTESPSFTMWQVKLN